jgi:hypothetical protein
MNLVFFWCSSPPDAPRSAKTELESSAPKQGQVAIPVPAVVGPPVVSDSCCGLREVITAAVGGRCALAGVGSSPDAPVNAAT